jgi:hypothetical protein
MSSSPVGSCVRRDAPINHVQEGLCNRLPQRAAPAFASVGAGSSLFQLSGRFIVIRILRRFAPVLALLAVFTLASAALAIDAKGKVKTVTADKNEFVMNDDTGKSWTIMVAKDAKVQLNGKDSKLADLQADDEVQISYEKDGEKLVASSIRATRK